MGEVTNGESHCARAQRIAETGNVDGGTFAIVHALLAVEEQLQRLAYLTGHGADVRRLDADDKTATAEIQ